MTTAISSLPGSSIASTPSSTSPTSSVARTSDAALPAQAVSLSTDAGIIAALGAGPSSSYVYDAAGLLDAIVNAGQAPATPLTVTAGSDVSTVAQNMADAGAVGTLATDAVSSGIYSSSGGLQSLIGGASSNWTAALKADPGLASVVVGDSFAQGLIGNIDTTA